MATDTRDRMIVAAAELFRTRGYDGTGFREVVGRAGAARGAIYHHFPDGKAELGVAVVEAVGGRLADSVEQACATSPPEEALATLLDLVETLLVRHGDRPGCPLAAVALAADDPGNHLRAATDAVFGRLRAALAACLVRDGVAQHSAAAYAGLAVAAAEGAVVLSRAHGGPEPFDQVRRSLTEALSGLARETD